MRREMMFAVVMIAVIVSVCIPIMSDEDSEASTDYDFIYSGIGYTINGDSATVVHSYGTRDVEIPETVYHNGSYYTVTRISDLADGNDENTTLRTLTIPDTVTSVYGSAFSLCPNLDTINVSSDNSYYSSDSDGILYNKDHTILVRAPPAMSMDRYDVDYGVVTVGSHAFEGCQISRIYLSSTVETIESYAFSNTLSLEHVNLSNVENLHSNLMSGSSIEHVNIPQSVTSIDRSFDNAQSLISIYVNPTNTHFSSDDQGILYDYDGRTLIKCPEGISGDVVISNDITTIGEDAFYRCRDITSVVLPDSLEDIESGAFKNCRGLLSINIPSSVSHIANDAFDCAFYDEDGNRISASASSLAGHTYSNDTPGGERTGTSKLGEGAAIKLMDSSVICHREVVAKLEELARAGQIPAQRDIISDGGTDGGPIHTTRAGVRTGGISIPCRYMHTPTEMVSLSDAAACVRLVCAFASAQLER